MVSKVQRQRSVPAFLVLGVVLALCFWLLSSCCPLHIPQKCQSDIVKESDPHTFRAFLNQEFSLVWNDDSGRHAVYRCKTPPTNGDSVAAENRPVLILHEYDHLSIACLEFAQRLSRAGFCVYVPLLFGKANGKEDFATVVRNTWAIATNGEWHAMFAEHQKQPITDWLSGLCRRISEAHRRRIGVIGMCLTGSLPIALMNDESVGTAVVAQPSMPLFACTSEGKRAPGISTVELNRAVERAHREHLRIFGTRYERDEIGKLERFQAIKDAFGPDCFEDHTIPASEYIGKLAGNDTLNEHAHATLTFCYRSEPDSYAPRRLFLDLVSFLRRELDKQGAR
jgi:dienelactone hydrolase